MAKHNEILNNFKSVVKNFDFKSQEHKSLVCIWHEMSLKNHSQTIYDKKKYTSKTWFFGFIRKYQCYARLAGLNDGGLLSFPSVHL